LALTNRWTLPNQLPPMVYGRGLLLGSGVRTMSKIEHYEYMLKELNLSDRHRYWVERELEQLRESEREGASK
jgi:hypothetical protein